jgi:hypothetical protein
MDSKPMNSVVVEKAPRKRAPKVAPKMVVIEEPAPEPLLKPAKDSLKNSKKFDPKFQKALEKHWVKYDAKAKRLIREVLLLGEDFDLETKEYEDLDDWPDVSKVHPSLIAYRCPPLETDLEAPKNLEAPKKPKKPRLKIAPVPGDAVPTAPSTGSSGSATPAPPAPQDPAPSAGYAPRSRRLPKLDRLSVHPASTVTSETLKESNDPLAIRDTLMREYYAVRTHTDDIIQKMCALVFKVYQNPSLSSSST